MESARILIVEDNLLEGEHLKLHLLQAGHRVEALVSSGEEALARTAEGGIDLMIIDIVLAGEIDGISATQQIHEKYDIPVIYLTAHVSDELLIRAEQTRPFAYLLKPYRQREMEFTVSMSLTRAQIERELTVQKLAAETELLQADAIIQNTNEGIMLTNTENVIISVNPAFTHITGYDAVDAVGRPAAFLSSGKHERAFYSDMWSSIELQGHWQGEIWNRRKNGDVYPEWLTINSIYNAEGSLSNYVGIFSDITSVKLSELERERLQRELSQTHKMEALGQLSSGIAHDFNNILGIIMGYVEISLKRYGDEVPEKMRTYLETVKQAAERAKDLVAQMLTFSRNDVASDQPLQFQPLLEENIKMLSSILPSSINIEMHCEEDLPLILMDATKLQQLLMNLCINAKDAMEGVGALVIKLGWHRNVNTECACCHKVVEGDWVELSVSDTGSGMTPVTLEHLFEPFYTTKELSKGTGMGMSVLHGIVTGHRGHTLIETELGKGTTFRLLFQPVIEQILESVNVDKLTEVAFQSTDKQILIVDDEPLLAEYFGELLELEGFHTTIKTDSKETLRLFQENPDKFDLLVTDQTMPGLTGTELIKQIRSIRPQLPVVHCSGNNKEINPDGIEDIGIRYLRKPIDSEKLMHSIGELLVFSCSD